MSRNVLRGMTIAEFLAWEEGQETRYEFDGLRPVPMPRADEAHARIQANLAGLLRARLARSACQVYDGRFKVEVADCIRYPDAFVAWGRWPGDTTLVHDPVIIFEVLGPATHALDRITKNREYAATPSILRYVMLESDRIAATVFARDAATWRGLLLGDGEMLMLPEIGLGLPLADLYAGLDLPADPDAAAALEPDRGCR